MNYALNLSLGTRLLEPDRTLFRIWAPGCASVYLQLDGAERKAMRRGEDNVFSCEASCGAGARYQFVTDTGLTVPDPVSRCQAEDVDGPSVVVDPSEYVWLNPQWQGREWREMVIYEVHVGCFGGSFEGVEARLPELRELGVTAIELMPIADFAGARNWGYDGVLVYAPDRAYGSPGSLKKMIDTAHGLGLCVYLDVVYNHFGPEGNYLGAYAPQFFADDADSPWGASIDFSNPEVREFYIENALYWLMEYRFDGLRFDAVHAILEPGWIEEAASRIRHTTEPGREVHLMLENERNQAGLLRSNGAAHGYDAQWNDDAHNVLHVLLTGESEGYYRNYADEPSQKLARCLSEGFVYQGDPYPDHHGRPRGTPSAHLPPTAFIFFLQNHDQIGNRALGERLTTLTDPDRLKAAITLQLMCPQIPLLFMGEEWGSDSPFLFFTDFHGELAEAVRDGRRREFSTFENYSNPELQLRIPDPNAISSFEQSRLPADGEPGTGYTDGQRRSRRFYQQLLELRRGEIAPRLDGCRSAGALVIAEGCVLARWRMGDASHLSIAVNLSAQPVPLSRPAGRLLAASDASDAGAAESLERGELRAASTIVFLAD